MNRTLLTLSLVHFFLSQTAFGFISIKGQRHRSKHSHHPIQQKVIRPDTYESSVPAQFGASYKVSSIKRDKLTGAVRLISGDFGRVQSVHTTPKHYEEFALEFLRSHFDLLGIRTEHVRLIPKATYIGKDVQFIQFARFQDGKVVEDSSLSFRFKRNKLVQIANFGFAEARVAEGRLLSQDLLEDSLIKETGARRLTKTHESYRVSEGEKGYTLIPVSNYEVLDRDNISLSIQIDRTSNKIYEQKENKFYLHGHASMDVYPRWYNENVFPADAPLMKVKQQPGPLGIMTTNVGTFEAADASTKVFVDSLSGQYVKIRNKSGSGISAEGVKNSDFWSLHLKKPDTDKSYRDKVTAQYMVYYHVTKMIGHAIQYIHPTWFDEPLVANTNLNSSCNAHWDGRTINLYSGSARCANTGLISDVIYHEWGHGLDANTGGIQDSAFSEGIGDIISLLITRSHLLGIGFMVADGSPVRDLAPNKVYPRDQGEVHDEGLIIGSTFWDLYEALRKKYSDDRAIDFLSQYILKGIYTARTYLDMYDAMLVIDDDDDNLENATPNTCLMNEVFAKHGLTTSLNWCTLATVGTLDLEDENKNGVLELGEAVEVTANATNPSPSDTLEGLVGTLSYEGDAIDIEDATLLWEPISPGSTAETSQKARFHIRRDATCGSSVELGLRLAADTREVFTKKSFTIGKNEGTADSQAASDLPKKIEDYTVTTSSLEVSGEQWSRDTVIHSASLKFSLKHSYTGDLSINLVSPEGEKFLVFKKSGRGKSVDYNEDITSLLKNKIAAGTWTLEIEDKAYRDTGALEEFTLELTPSLFRCE